MTKKNKEIQIPQYLYEEIIELETQADAIREAFKYTRYKRPFKLLLKKYEEYKKKKEGWWNAIRSYGDFPKGKKLEYNLIFKTVKISED